MNFHDAAKSLVNLIFVFYNFKCMEAVKVNYDQTKNIYNKDTSPLAPREKNYKIMETGRVTYLR
jgi:hypothetical protein